jgi:hypothetical protein
VAWRPLAELPLVLATRLWWASGLALFVVLVAWLWARSSLVGLVLITILAPELAWTAWSGNVNVFVVPLLASVWVMAAARPRWSGAAVAMATALRLSPVVVALWLAIVASRRALLWLLVAGGGIAVVSLLGAGWSNHVAWLEQARYFATTGTAQTSVQRVLIDLGAPALVVGASGPLLMALSMVAIVAARQRPALGWLLASLAIVLVLPIQHSGMGALLALVALPFQSVAGGRHLGGRGHFRVAIRRLDGPSSRPARHRSDDSCVLILVDTRTN